MDAKQLHELAKATDTKLAELWETVGDLLYEVERLEDSIHYEARDSRKYPDYAWGKELGECIEIASSQSEYSKKRVDEALVKIKEAKAKYLHIRKTEIPPLDAIYEAHRWSRFFLVVSSDGHVHSSQDCHTCYWKTRYAWLPTLSGLTEADAVEQEGEILCSVCFPSAPVSWTNGISRKDKDAKAKREAEKAVKLAEKIEKSLSEDGSVVEIRSDDQFSRYKEFKTLRAGELWLVEALTYVERLKQNLRYTWGKPDAFSPENVELVRGLVAKKKGISVEELDAIVAPKVAKKLLKD